MVAKVIAGGVYELAPDAGGTTVVANPGTGSTLLSNITIGAEDYALPFQVTANPAGIHGALTGLNISGSEYSVPEEVIFVEPDDVVLTQSPNTYRFDDTLTPQPGHIYFFSPKATNDGPVHILINGVSYGFLEGRRDRRGRGFRGWRAAARHPAACCIRRQRFRLDRRDTGQRGDQGRRYRSR